MLEAHRDECRSPKFMMRREIKKDFPEVISLELSFGGQVGD